MARTQLAEVVHGSLEQRPIENDSSMEAALYGEVSHVSQPANLTAVCRSSRRSAAATWRETAHILFRSFALWHTHKRARNSSLAQDSLLTRAFQFGQKSFDSIRFANLINLPLLH